MTKYLLIALLFLNACSPKSESPSPPAPVRKVDTHKEIRKRLREIASELDQIEVQIKTYTDSSEEVP
jgi:hypothetical protein